MSKVIDLTGQRFGRLTVLERDKTKNKGDAYWICRCDCGNILSISGRSLRRGCTQSCGCYRKEQLSKRKGFKDLTGQKFGKLTVLRLDKVRSGKGKGAYWICQCECGNIVSVRRGSLISGKTLSCGCIKRLDLTGQRFGKLTALYPDTLKNSHATYWVCLCDCGNKVSVRVSSLTTEGQRSCGCMTESHGETDINAYLCNYGLIKNVDYKRQVKFDDLCSKSGRQLSYDFEILRPFHCLIEYQGRQHYIPISYFGGQRSLNVQVSHDKLKAEYARDHNIPLYYISYKNDTYEKVEQAMDDIFDSFKMKNA